MVPGRAWWSRGSVVPGLSGPRARWSQGLVVPGLGGPRARWSQGSVLSGSVVPGLSGPRAQWSQGLVVPHLGGPRAWWSSSHQHTDPQAVPSQHCPGPHDLQCLKWRSDSCFRPSRRNKRGILIRLITMCSRPLEVRAL